MSGLSEILKDTLLFTASAGRPLIELPLNHVVPRPPVPKENDSKNSLWSWRLSNSELDVIKDLRCNNPYLEYESMLVCERIKWEKIEIKFKNKSAINLPLDSRYLLKKYFLPSGEVTGENSYFWKLPASIDSSHLIVFGYQLDSDASAVPVVIPKFEWESDGFMPSRNLLEKSVFPRPTGVSHKFVIPTRRVVVCISLVCCKEKDDWDPLNSLDAARIYAHMMVMTNFDMNDGDQLTAVIDLQRPRKSTHVHDAKRKSAHAHGASNEHLNSMSETMNDDIRPFLFTDTNNLANGAWSFTSSITSKKLPYWDNLFDYYDLNPLKGSSKFVAVDPDSKSRSIAKAVSYRNNRKDSFGKVDRQGEFDNLHLAPTMKFPKELRSIILEVPSQEHSFDFDDVKMSPICMHDCLHTHWRWNDAYGDPQNKGWSELGPNSKAGAPLVPMNQKVEVNIYDSSFRTVVTIAKGFKSGDWQVINHNGSAYALNADWQASGGKFVTAFASKLYPDFLRSFIAAGEWWAFYWNLRYDYGVNYNFKIYEKMERVNIHDLAGAKR